MVQNSQGQPPKGCINPSCNCDLVFFMFFWSILFVHMFGQRHDVAMQRLIVVTRSELAYQTTFVSIVSPISQSPVLQLRFWTHLSYRRKTWGSPRRRSKCSKLSRMRAPCEPNCRSVGWLSYQRKNNNLRFQRLKQNRIISCVYIYNRRTYSITIKEETPQHTHFQIGVVWKHLLLLGGKDRLSVQVAQQTSAQARPSPEIPTFKQVGVMWGGHSQVLRSNLHRNMCCLQWGIRSHFDLLVENQVVFIVRKKTSTWGGVRSEVLIGWSKSILNNMSSGIFGWYCWWKKSCTTWDV